MGEIEIINPGLLTTVQDQGRYGYQASGFSVSGCMDTRAYHDANVLVNNDLSAAVLEMLFMGPTIRFRSHTYFAITGADMSPKLNGKVISNYKTYEVFENDVLKMEGARSGRYAYLSLSGGVLVSPVMESRSTNLKCALGGYEGRALKKGDVIFVGDGCKEMLNMYLKEMEPIFPKEEITLRVVKGPQIDYFTEQGKETFENSVYTVSEQSDRMGYRLEGNPIEYKDKVDILSDGIVFGSIQIPPKGTPMIMMADRQTTGGYAKIGTVISADLPILAQSMPNTKVRFTFVSVEEAVKADKKEEHDRKRFRRKSGYYIKK